MQNTSELLVALSGKGISVSLVGDMLKIEPKELLTDEIRIKLRTHKPQLIMALSCAALPSPKKVKPPISPVALDWLLEHRSALKAAGWTARELYRANKSKGICWCGLWDKAFFKAYQHDNGIIEMECVIAGRDVIQTSRPMPQRTNKKEGARGQHL